MRIDSPVMTSAIATGSFSGSFTGTFDGDIQADSVEFANVLNKPTLISSSAQLQDDFLDTLGDGVISSSAQVTLTSASGYDANEHIDHTGVTLTAGNGLTGGGTIAASRTFAVGAGDGITVNADDVAVDATVLRTTGDSIVSSSAQVVALVEAGTDSNTFTDADHTKLNGIEASADVTDTANVTAAGALMDSELSEIATVKALTAAGISGSFTAASASFSTRVTANDAKLTANTSNVTSAGALMDSELTSIADVKALDQSVISGASPTFSTANMTDASNKRFMTDAQETKLDSVESNADVTDTANVTSAGALMDSEVTSLALIKGLTAAQISGSLSNSAIAALGGGHVSASVLSSPSQGTIRLATNGVNTDVDSGLQTGDSPTFSGLTVSNNVTINGNLNVLGTKTELQVATLNVEDKNITIASGAADSSAADGAGITIDGANESLTWDHGNSRFTFSDDLNVGGNITVTGTVDGRDVATDGTKLDGIESGATADQTAAEIRTLVGNATDSNVFTDADHSKLDGIEAGADVTDATNVTAAGALMDSEVTNLAQVKAFDSSDYATAAQGTTADAALARSGGQMTGNITFSGAQTVDGRDLSADGSKLDGIEASADVTDTANVTAAGALMDSELTNLAAVKAINQSLVTTADVRFDSLGIGTAAPGTSGVIRATNDIVAFYSSDERLKDNVEEIPNALDKVESIRGVHFDWNDKQEVYEGHDIGVIAQEVEKVLPEIVENRDNGYKAVKYEKLTAVLIEAVKELSAKVKELENK